MPYIISTGYHAKRSPDDLPDVSLWVEETAHAVATLDEAREAAAAVTAAVIDVVGPGLGPDDPIRGEWLDCLDAIDALPENGGTIGPLPDETIIEVQEASWSYLVLNRRTAAMETAVLDAYNEGN